MDSEAELASKLQLLEESLLKPDIRKSSDMLSYLLLDDFIEIGSSGKMYYKEDVIGALDAENLIDISLADFKVKILSDGVVLVTFKAVKRAMQNKVGYSLRSSIWKLVDGNWKIAFHQGTAIGNNYIFEKEKKIQDR